MVLALSDVWSRSAAPALIEQEHAVARRIEQPPMIGRGPRRAAVQNHRGPAARMAALPSDRVAIRDIENARGVRLDRRIGMAALCVGRSITMRATFPLCRSRRQVASAGPRAADVGNTSDLITTGTAPETFWKRADVDEVEMPRVTPSIEITGFW